MSAGSKAGRGSGGSSPGRGEGRSTWLWQRPGQSSQAPPDREEEGGFPPDGGGGHAEGLMPWGAGVVSLRKTWS